MRVTANKGNEKGARVSKPLRQTSFFGFQRFRLNSKAKSRTPAGTGCRKIVLASYNSVSEIVNLFLFSAFWAVPSSIICHFLGSFFC